MKRCYLPLFAVSLAVAPLYVPPVVASSSSTSVMDEVVVTASRIGESKKEISANVDVITNEDISNSLSVNVGDLLAEKNLGHIQKYPGSLTSIGIRGFRTDTTGNDLQGHVLILLDGRRAGSGNVDKFLTKNVERIEIIRGPGAVQYGSGGMGGVINIITKQGTKNSMFAEAGAGSFDTYEGSIGGEVKQDAFDFAGSFTSATRDDYKTGDGERYHNTGIDYQNGISANLGYSFSETQRLGVIFTSFDVNKSGSPGYISQSDLDDYSNKDNYSTDLKYTGATADSSYQWMARYFIGRDKNKWVDPIDSNPDFYDDGEGTTNKTDQMGAQIQASRTFDISTLTVGFDWLDYEVENSYAPEKTVYDNPALFLLGNTSVFDRQLTLNYGLRYDWYHVKVKEGDGNDEDQTHLTPMIGVAYQVTNYLKLRAQFAQAFMMPSASQLSADYDTSYGSHIQGNPDLNPEKSTTYEGGVDVDWKGLAASLTYFYTDFKDKIVSDYLAGGSQSWENLGDATIAGFETNLSYDIGVPLQWSWEVRPYFQATFLTEYEDKETNDDLYYTSGTQYSAGVKVNNGNGIFCQFNVNHTGSQDIQDWESGTYPTPIVKLDSVTIADFTASWRFYEDETFGALTARGEVSNIFDKEYAYVNGYPMPGRGLFISLRWDY